jgi:Peptidase inhibitor I78 family
VAKAALLALVLAVAGCVAAEPEQNACGADGLQSLIGQDDAVLAAMTFPQGTRFLYPGTPVTEDYSPVRLNIDIEQSGTITGVWCG